MVGDAPTWADTAGRTPRAEFARLLGDLYRAAGNPSLRQLAAAAQRRVSAAEDARPAGLVSAQRISDWKSGRAIPARFETFMPVLLELVRRARQRSHLVESGLLDVRRWKRLWMDAQPPKAQRATAYDSPFRGAEPYVEKDTAIFTGREHEIRELANLLDIAATADDRHRIVALVGAAGVGKTALLEAGLPPALKGSSTHKWRILTITLNEETARRIADPIARTQWLDKASAGIGTVKAETTALLVIDGFEVFFSRCLDDATRERILQFLTAATTIGVVLISLRPDWTNSSTAYPLLADTLAHRSYVLDAMNAEELRAVISQPARLRGVKVESGLEEVLLTAIVGNSVRRRHSSFRASNLAILAMTMRAIWQERNGARLTVADYRRIGGVEGVLHRAADAAWSNLSPAQHAHAELIILRMVSCREDADDTRRQVSRQELNRVLGGGIIAISALRDLVSARVITTTQDAAFLSHDLLLTWPRLMAWLDDGQSSTLVTGGLGSVVGLPDGWVHANRAPETLHGVRRSFQSATRPLGNRRGDVIP